MPSCVAVTSGTFFNYVFNYTDHLGNIRLSYTENNFTGEAIIMEENHYYPFGLKHKAYNAQEYMYKMNMDETPGYYYPTISEVVPKNPNPYKYKYNGKELQDELGLNLYDYGARNYDAAIGRWMNIDPLAENSRRWTPYNYAYNNPMFFVDPDGMQAGPGPKPAWFRTTSFAVSHPIAAYNIGKYERGSTNISTNSTRFATRGEVLEGAKKGQEDRGSQNGALRHTLWQATITTKYGSDIAKQAGDAHEENPSSPTGPQIVGSLEAADERADLSNNIIGRQIGEANSDLGMKDLALKVLETFKTDGLFTATKIKTGTSQKGEAYVITRTKISDEQYNKLKDIYNNLIDNGRTQSEQNKIDEKK